MTSKSNAMNKLLCSLRSDLPNEVEYAIKVATILSNSNNFTWSDDYQLVDAICSSIHVYACICEDDVPVCKCYQRFWKRILKTQANEECLQASTLPHGSELKYLNFDKLTIHSYENHNEIGRRIKTVGELLKQLSMTCVKNLEKNELPSAYSYYQIKKKKLKASPPLLKFISLLLHCDDTSFNHLGMDILSNVASKLSKLLDSTDPICSKLVSKFQEHCADCIVSQDGDIYHVNRSIEVISKLISSSSKQVLASTLNLITEKNLIFRIEQLLTSNYDVTLFYSALECCYRISKHQPHLLTTGRARYLTKILVNLLNCDEERYFTTRALKRIKIIDGGTEDPPTWYDIPPAKIVPVDPPAPVAVKAPAITQSNPRVTPEPPKPPASKEYTCEWNNCGLKFVDPKSVYSHVYYTHINILGPDELSSCLWSSPSGTGPGCLTKRPKYSILTHLNEFHCNCQALERALNRNQPPIKPPGHPGYAPNAALLAIKRHASQQNQENETNKYQSPLSVSVRLTAALILRNLATDSPEVKQALENHETLLSEICMSNGRDESKIIAECLSLLASD